MAPAVTAAFILCLVGLADAAVAAFRCRRFRPSLLLGDHDSEVIAGFRLLSESEGIIPALECAHAVAWISREAPKMQGQTVLMNLSGRGDKDVAQMMDILADADGNV